MGQPVGRVQVVPPVLRRSVFRTDHPQYPVAWGPVAGLRVSGPDHPGPAVQRAALGGLQTGRTDHQLSAPFHSDGRDRRHHLQLFRFPGNREHSDGGLRDRTGQVHERCRLVSSAVRRVRRLARDGMGGDRLPGSTGRGQFRAVRVGGHRRCQPLAADAVDHAAQHSPGHPDRFDLRRRGHRGRQLREGVSDVPPGHL